MRTWHRWRHAGLRAGPRRQSRPRSLQRVVHDGVPQLVAQVSGRARVSVTPPRPVHACCPPQLRAANQLAVRLLLLAIAATCCSHSQSGCAQPHGMCGCAGQFGLSSCLTLARPLPACVQVCRYGAAQWPCAGSPESAPPSIFSTAAGLFLLDGHWGRVACKLQPWGAELIALLVQ